MVEITRGKETLVVTSGAFRAFFEGEGWRRVDEEKEEKIDVSGGENDPRQGNASESEETLSEEEEKDESDDEGDEEEPEDDAESEDEDESEDDEDDLSEKPFSEMTKRELREYAELHKISLEGVADRLDDLREAIKKALKE